MARSGRNGGDSGANAPRASGSGQNTGPRAPNGDRRPAGEETERPTTERPREAGIEEPGTDEGPDVDYGEGEPRVGDADLRADEEEAAAAAHDPVGPSGYVEERDLTGGPATALPERTGDPTHPEAGIGDVILEGPEAGPVFHEEPYQETFVAEAVAHAPPLGEAVSHHRRGDERESRVVLDATLGSRWLLPLTSTLHLTRAWIRDTALAVGTDDPRAAWNALRAVLTTLRDQLPAAEVADAASELPVMVRGAWYDGWTGRAEPARTREAFVATVEARLGRAAEIDAEAAIGGVVRVLRERISSGELRHMEGVLPRTLKGLLVPA
jgi:uncharacterized protein (DUF2267 family)